MGTHSLETLPTEVILGIADNVSVPDLNSLLRASRGFQTLLDPRLYERAVDYCNVPGVGTPLIWAVQQDLHPVMEKLLERGVAPSACFNGRTALHEAIRLENEGVVQRLLSAGADMYVRNDDDISAFELAIDSNQEALLKLLLDAAMDNVEKLNAEWGGMLMQAVHQGHETSCRLLLECPPPYKTVALNYALYNHAPLTGRCDIMRMLIEAGADPVGERDDDGDQPNLLHVITRRGEEDSVKLCLEYGADANAVDQGESTLDGPVVCGYPAVIQILIDAGADVNGPGQYRPLVEAARHGHVDVVKCLLDNGADVTVCDSHGFTALDMAACGEKGEMIDLLVAKGADPSRTTNGGITPLHWTAEGGFTGSAEALCRAGAPVNAMNDEGRTPLFLAAAYGYKEVVEVLVQAGADPSLWGEGAFPPLHAVAAAHDGALMNVLIDAGADITMVDSSGHTALHVAAKENRPTTLRTLLTLFEERGFPCLTPCNDGRTALEEATESNAPEIIEIFLQKKDLDLNKHWKWSSALHAAAARHAGSSVEPLLSRGADPYALDLYGRSSLDWASLHPPTLDVFLQHCEQRTTDPKARRTQLFQTISTFGRRLLRQGDPSAHVCNFCTLGKALLLIGDDDAASQVYAHASGDENDPGASSWTCDECHQSPPEISGRRHVCRSCREFDFCSDCIVSYCARNSVADGCQGHTFLEVPEGCTELPGEAENGREKAWKEWLQQLIEGYEAELGVD